MRGLGARPPRSIRRRCAARPRCGRPLRPGRPSKERESMPATALDPRTALVVIDLQRGLAAYPTVHPFRDVVSNTRRLAEAFRRADAAGRVRDRQLLSRRPRQDPLAHRGAASPRALGPDGRPARAGARAKAGRHPHHEAPNERVLRHRARSPAPAPSNHRHRAHGRGDEHGCRHDGARRARALVQRDLRLRRDHGPGSGRARIRDEEDLPPPR